MKKEIEKLDVIMAALTEQSGVTEAEIKGQCRKRELVEQRHRYCFLARTLTTFSLEDIGKYLGDRDHTTIIYSFNQELARIRIYADEGKLMEQLSKKTGLTLIDDSEEFTVISNTMGISFSTFQSIKKSIWKSGFEAGKRFYKSQENATYRKGNFDVDEPEPKKTVRHKGVYSNMRLYENV